MEIQAKPSAQYEITIRIECPHEPGWIAKIAGVISESGGAIGAIDLVQVRKGQSLRDYSIECVSTDHDSYVRYVRWSHCKHYKTSCFSNVNFCNSPLAFK